jgi:hypothetical protein
MVAAGLDVPQAREERAAWWAGLWPQWMLLTAFWMYVALSNVLYASSMQASLTSMNINHVYAAWDARLVQHAILYPLFLGCMWAALKIGWRPIALLLQLPMALAFSILASPALWWADLLRHGGESDMHGMMAWGPGAWMAAADRHVWIAGATSFLCNYGFGLALATGFAFYRRLCESELNRETLERALSAAQLAALRMQLSPHTLFNLLHTIRGHISWDPAQAQTMVVQLGDLLRGLLVAGRRELMPLYEEMQLARVYLALQQTRFSDRLSVQVPPCECEPRAWVPSLVLQPLIENAVVHGLAGHDGRVTIRVEVLAREESLLLRVTNTMGVRPRAGGTGIGLANLRERLAIQFGGRASLHAVVGVDRVWLAEVRLPLLRAGPSVPATVSGGWEHAESRV